MNKGSVGATIGIIIILAVILLGGFYFWEAREKEDRVLGTEEMINELNSQSSSDDPEAIRADLESTNYEDLDAGLQSY